MYSHPENARRRGRALARVAAWQAWERVIGLPWTVDLYGGRRLRCYPHSTAASGVIYCRLPEWHDMRFVLAYVAPGDMFVDIGANVGVYSLLATAIPDVRVVAFEPSTPAREHLGENVSLNGLSDRVAVEDAALSDVPGTSALTVGLDTINHMVDDRAVLFPSDRLERVPVTTLDAYLSGGSSDSRVALVKIDVEGLELKVLQGSLDTIRSHQPAFVVENNDPSGLEEFFRHAGYRICGFDPQSGQLFLWTSRPAAGNNIIAVPDLEAAQERLSQRYAQPIRGVKHPQTSRPRKFG